MNSFLKVTLIAAFCASANASLIDLSLTSAGAGLNGPDTVSQTVTFTASVPTSVEFSFYFANGFDGSDRLAIFPQCAGSCSYDIMGQVTLGGQSYYADFEQVCFINGGQCYYEQHLWQTWTGRDTVLLDFQPGTNYSATALISVTGIDGAAPVTNRLILNADVVSGAITTQTAAPEPASFALAGSALLLIAGLWYGRKHNWQSCLLANAWR